MLHLIFNASVTDNHITVLFDVFLFKSFELFLEFHNIIFRDRIVWHGKIEDEDKSQFVNSCWSGF